MPNTPTRPITGHDIEHLRLTLEPVTGDLKDVDVAMLLNVAPNRLRQILKAGMAKGEDPAEVIPPPTGILVRLLQRHPNYTPLVSKPQPMEVFETIKIMLPTLQRVAPGKSPHDNRMAFGPVFGRSSIVGYKLLESEEQSVSGTLIRLMTLVMCCLADQARKTILEQLDGDSKHEHRLHFLGHTPWDWRLLLELDKALADYIPIPSREKVKGLIEERQAQWWSETYLQVVKDEAASRNLDVERTLKQGKWTNRETVTDADLREYPTNTRPILGGTTALIGERLRTQFTLTNAEYHWVQGVAPVVLFRQRKEKASQRVDATTAILLRYLSRHPKDLGLLIPPSMTGDELSEWIATELDPEFRNINLGPLLGGSVSRGYRFLREPEPPRWTRRLTTIIQQQRTHNPGVYDDIKQAMREEAVARGLDPEKVWNDGIWSPESNTQSGEGDQ